MIGESADPAAISARAHSRRLEQLPQPREERHFDELRLEHDQRERPAGPAVPTNQNHATWSQPRGPLPRAPYYGNTQSYRARLKATIAPGHEPGRARRGNHRLEGGGRHQQLLLQPLENPAADCRSSRLELLTRTPERREPG